jgi:predicted  nucleic acid-binding Zn-ribbon protein
MNKNELLNLKNEIETAKTTVSSLNGKLEYLMASLKDQHGCKTIKEAEKKIKVLEEKSETLQERIETATTELEEKYELINEGE